MQIVKDGEVWQALCSYEERALPKAAGFRWDPVARRWWTNDPVRVKRLEEATCPKVREARHAERVTAIAASRATDADVSIPAPDGLAYLPYQRAGIAFARNREGALIGDEMGLGKTIQALGIVNADDSIKRVLVICPASLKLNWQREAERWLVRPMTIGIANGSLPDTDVVILNYDVLGKHATALRETHWDLLVCDEAHYLKNPQAIRSAMVYGGTVKGVKVEPIRARRRVFLTGTPIPNRPIEVWPLLASLDPEKFGNKFRFGHRYCGAQRVSIGRGRTAWDFSGATNLEELQAEMRSTVMVRRLKADVLTELPPKRRQVVEVATDGKTAGLVARERRAYERFQSEIEEAEVRVELAKAESDEAYKAAVARLRDIEKAAFTEMAIMRREVAEAKAPMAVDFIENALEDSPKVVVFAHHIAAIDLLVGGLGDRAVKLDGRDSMAERQAAVDRFQTDPTCRVFIGGIHAAGVGLTLTAASHVIFVELDWTPGNMTQAEDRCHRIGQRNSVLVQHLVFDESLDARIAKRLVAKQSVIDRALDAEITVEEPDLPATVATRPKDLDREAPTISPERVAAIHEALRHVQSLCDGARVLDGHGFSRFDAGIGRSLAEAPSLTPKQAALGLRLVRKYRRQIPEATLEAATGVTP